MAAVLTLPAPSPTLLESEESLGAFLDTIELVEPDQEQQFLEDFAAQLEASHAKRDRVAGQLSLFEMYETYCATEIKRLQALKAANEKAREHLERYITYVIERLGKDAKGKWRKLQGRTSVLSLAACPASIEITAEKLVPIEYKRATVTMPADLWNNILFALDDKFAELVIEETKKTLSLTVDKRALHSALEAKIPGVDAGSRIVTDRTSVRRK